ncbi:MAG: DEAD/DEAH box helicase [Spirochaetaceae bacterium]|jgi:ATP-dependent RNA helicase DeaD|nr:DEAD/DEAH box helicase [Spirochaetaceae bacterium]
MIIDYNHPFSSFGLSAEVLAALTRKGFVEPTPIQSVALPRLLADQGHLIVKARTGTGKTAAFGIPLVERLTQGGRLPRALVLTPTRELALQVSREIASLVSGPFPRITAVYGGASMRNQIRDLKVGTEIVVGTPGRIMDLMERKVLDLSAVDWFVLDEADEMLDMGFFEDVEKIMGALKPERRVALFSATMPPAILGIVRRYIGDAEILEDAAPEDEKPAVDQYYMVLRREDRQEALRRVMDQADVFYGLVFCATKAGADELARNLTEEGYSAEAIHGDLSQEARERTLRRFRSRLTAKRGEVSILAATDVAARGLDITGLTHVINWDFPGDSETYVHRIGRTGRAGRRGVAVSLILPGERGRLSHLSRTIRQVLGSPIQEMKAPPVPAVMDALRERIAVSVAGVFPESAGGTEPPAENASVSARLSRELIAAMGSERAVEALVTLSYGELLNPARYRPIAELKEAGGPRDEKKPGRVRGKRALSGRFDEGRPHGAVYPGQRHGPGRYADRAGPLVSRVYVGLGRRHGASARDVAGLLMRAGGVPGRLVDAIEMRDYCAFATLPQEAAKRACAFSRKTPDDPAIKPADSPENPGKTPKN